MWISGRKRFRCPFIASYYKRNNQGCLTMLHKHFTVHVSVADLTTACCWWNLSLQLPTPPAVLCDCVFPYVFADFYLQLLDRLTSQQIRFKNLWQWYINDWLRAGRPRGWISSPGRVKNFLHAIQTGSEAHPTFYSMGIGGSFPWGKAVGREADH
jgi:hypothetical protein